MSAEPSSKPQEAHQDGGRGVAVRGVCSRTEHVTGCEAEFAQIDALLDQGQGSEAHALTEALARAAAESSSPPIEARIQLRRARAHLARSEFERARDSARKAAAELAGADGAGLPDEVDAHAVRARASSMLGRSVEAVGSALLAVRLAESLQPGPWTVRAHLALGVAYAWAGATAQAFKALDLASHAAARHGDASLRFDIAIERQWAVVVGGPSTPHGQRFLSYALGVDGLLQAWDEWETSDGEAAGWTPAAAARVQSAALAGALTCLWAGEAAEASRLWARAASSTNAHPVQGWLLAAQSWWEGEWAVRDAATLDAAALHADRMTKWAADLRLWPLVSQAHRLAAHVHAVAGDWRLAVERQAALRSVEHQMQVQHLESCEDSVSDRMAARASERSLKTLQAESTTYWQWAHEDALTGIANLRRFNQCLEAWTAEAEDAGQALSVAVIDVDKFKAINDTISHEAGDLVLKGIAQEMVAHVRDRDLPARWGGDEFAILFRDADETKALQVARRIEDAIRQRDWRDVLGDLEVSISVGVVQARPGETKLALRDRADAAMYAQKNERRREALARLLPAVLVRRIARELRRANRVVFFVGSGTAPPSGGATADSFGAWDDEARAAYGHIDGLRSHPALFNAFWSRWRAERRTQEPLALHRSLVRLANALPQVKVVTERTDGMLAKAGAVDVVELYGNVFHDRCHACGRVRPNVEAGRCMACGASEASIRPNIVLLGEHVDPQLLAGTELLFKRADVVLVVDSDCKTYPGAGLVEKAAARDATVFVLGGSGPARHEGAYQALGANPALLLDAVLEALSSDAAVGDMAAELSDGGIDALCFLSGIGADHRGTTLAQVLEWSDVELAGRLDVQPWLFPLTTRSRVNPGAPQPTRTDFEVLAKDPQVRDGMRKAFLRMLRHYGFEWRDGKALPGPDWRSGFAIWALSPSSHDQFISRILGALTLCGLREEALAFLDALRPEVTRFRGSQAEVPLYHWNLAVSAA